MATQVNSYSSRNVGACTLHVLDATLITSGTTITFTFPTLGKNIYNVFFHNITTNALTASASFVKSTGVWTSGTMAVNDQAIVTILTD